MAEERSNEWPLVAFTVGLELCSGITIAIATLDTLCTGDANLVRDFGIAIFPLALVAVVGSMLHLARPFAAPRALLNLGSSRLSTEVAITSVFAAMSFLYSALWFTHISHLRTALGIATASTGALAVLSSARIYTIRTQPFWHSAWVTCSFTGATLLFAGVSGLLALGDRETRGFSIIAASAFVGAALLLVSAGWMLARLKRVSKLRYSNPCAPPLVKSTDWASLLGFVLLTGVLPLISIFARRFPLPIAAGTLALLLILGLIGVVLGRRFMYSLGTSLSRF